MNNLENIAAVILAAGASSRLGQPKQLVPFAGKNLLQYTLDVVSSFTFGSKIMVLGAEHAKILSNISLNDFGIIMNNDWQEGIGSSIRVATQNISGISSIEQIIIFLSDQPYVNQDLIRRLLQNHQNEITACRYQENVGVPAIFSRRYFSALTELQDDTGARKIIKKYMDKVSIVDFEMGYFDVDTAKDLEKLASIKTEKNES